MHATYEKEGPAGYGFTVSEVAAASSRSRANVANPGVSIDRMGKPHREFGEKSNRRLTPSNRAWCARLALDRNLPQPPIEEALTLLNLDRLLVENVLNTAEQTGFAPMTIVESILERRG